MPRVPFSGELSVVWAQEDDDATETMERITAALAQVGVSVEVASAAPMKSGDVIPDSWLARRLVAA